MKFKLFLIFAIVFVFGISFGNSLSQTISVNYNGVSEIYDSSVQYSQGIPFEDILLKVTTTKESICRFSDFSGVDYDSMTEVFDETGALIHKKTFLDLNDGTHKYYVKCSNNTLHEPEESEVILRVNSLVTGQVLVSSEPPLTEGMYGIKLITSKIISQTPEISYSFNDGVDSKPLILMGQGKVWEGYIILGKNAGEGKLSFTMRAVDLEGRSGTEITSGKVYLYDTIKPAPITVINAKSLEGRIELKWETEEENLEFKIYRSDSSNPDYSDYYKTVDDLDYTDNAVTDGKTYYYRIIAIDEAGNEGDFSKEVSGTSLSKNYNYVESGLSSNLVGKVESFLNEIDLVRDEIKVSKSTFDSKSGKEKELIVFLGVNKKIEKVLNDLDSLQKTVEKYKLQDLSSEELTQRIDSSRIKLGVIEKDIPENLNILDESNRKEDLSEVSIEEAIFAIDPTISESSKEKSLEQSLDLMEETGFSVQSNFYEVELNYFSGLNEDYYFVERIITSELDRRKDIYVVENFPLNIVSSGAEIDFGNSDSQEISDRAYSFESDLKGILYSVSKGSISDLKNIQITLVSMYQEDESSSTLTGLFLFDSIGSDSSFVFLGIFLFLVLAAYLFYFRKGDFSDDYFRILNKIEEGFMAVEEDNLIKSKEIYSKVKSNYFGLPEREKKEIYKRVDKLFRSILISEFEFGLDQLRQTKDSKLLVKLNKIYEELPREFQEKISSSFFEIKKSFGEINEI